MAASPFSAGRRGGVDLAGLPVGGECAGGVARVLPRPPQATEVAEQLARLPVAEPDHGAVEQAGHPGEVSARLEGLGEGQGGGEVIGRSSASASS